MQGAEYLSEAALVGVWEDLDAWVRGEVAAGGEGLSGFLKRRAPLWHQVGRVCFHLAENRRNEDYPFAFLATYAPGVAAGARVQYQPLSRALQELAGAKNKQALVRLLGPVHLASQQSALVKELVDSGDIYQPLAWTPREAYRFLKDVPSFEESGVLVRLPDWWKKRPRPRVGVTIGDAKQKKFDADAMLDFKVQLALGDETTHRGRMARVDGGRRRAGSAARPMGRSRPPEAAGGARPLEAGAGAGRGRPVVHRRDAAAGGRARRSWPTEANDGEDRQWSFVHAGPVARRNPRQDAKPGESSAGSRRRRAQGHAAEVPGDGRRLAAVPVGPGAWGLSGRRHGAGQDRPGLGAAVGLEEARGARKPSLLVLPASLLANWKAEMARFTPTLRALFVHPAEMPKEELDRVAADPAGTCETPTSW